MSVVMPALPPLTKPEAMVNDCILGHLCGCNACDALRQLFRSELSRQNSIGMRSGLLDSPNETAVHPGGSLN